MAARKLDERTAMLALLPHVAYTLSRLRARPAGAAHVATFEALRAEGVAVLNKELALAEGLADAQARVDMADDNLDVFAPKVSKGVLTIARDDRQNALHVHLFKGMTVSEFRKPVLGGQLEAMRQWKGPLEQSPHATLQAMAPELVALLAEADAAVAAREAARQANRYFRDVGERKQWIDRLNARRKELYGALAKLPYEDPALPGNFADQFFLKDSRREAADGNDETPDALRRRIDETRVLLADLEGRLSATEAAEAEAKKAEAARAEAKAKLAELDQAAAELAVQRAALEAQLSTPA